MYLSSFSLTVLHSATVYNVLDKSRRLEADAFYYSRLYVHFYSKFKGPCALCTELLGGELERRVVLREVLLVRGAEVLLAAREVRHELPVFGARQVEPELPAAQQRALEISPGLSCERAAGETVEALKHCVHVFARSAQQKTCIRTIIDQLLKVITYRKKLCEENQKVMSGNPIVHVQHFGFEAIELLAGLHCRVAHCLRIAHVHIETDNALSSACKSFEFPQLLQESFTRIQ